MIALIRENSKDPTLYDLHAAATHSPFSAQSQDQVNYFVQFSLPPIIEVGPPFTCIYLPQVLSTIQVTNSAEKPAVAADALQAAVESAEVDKMDTTNIMFSSTSMHSQRQQQQNTAG